jgi:chemosensory pili system protein ChpA (sensor histidine kinase/response regulator)
MSQEENSSDAECNSLGAAYSSYTILLAEDDEALRRHLSRCLTHLGFRVVEARDGVDALIAAAPIDIDLLLTDIEMPHLNGFDLAAKTDQTSPLDQGALHRWLAPSGGGRI